MILLIGWKRLLAPLGMLAVLLVAACAATVPEQAPKSQPPTAILPSATPKNEAQSADKPLVRILQQADRVRNRLRFFAEEIKTTYKKERQTALLANVHETVHPAWQEMKKIVNEEKVDNAAARDMEALCARLDTALEENDLKLLQSVLKDFNATYERLRQAAQ